MKIAILSDSHDNIWNLEKARPFLSRADVLLHCGDLISPFMVARLRACAPNAPIHAVWGNNDGDKRLLAQKALDAGDFSIHGEIAVLEIEGLRVAINHYPEIAIPLAASMQFDLVCYGHDHTRHESRVGDTLLINPGELMGMNGPATFVLLDVALKTLEWVTLDR